MAARCWGVPETPGTNCGRARAWIIFRSESFGLFSFKSLKEKSIKVAVLVFFFFYSQA